MLARSSVSATKIATGPSNNLRMYAGTFTLEVRFQGYYWRQRVTYTARMQPLSDSIMHLVFYHDVRMLHTIVPPKKGKVLSESDNFIVSLFMGAALKAFRAPDGQGIWSEMRSFDDTVFMNTAMNFCMTPPVFGSEAPHTLQEL